MALNVKQLLKRAKEYVELEGNTEVTSITFNERFYLLGREDVVLSIKTTDKDEPEWWVVGGSTPMNLYAKSRFRTADEVFSMHTGLMLRLSARDFEQALDVKVVAEVEFDAETFGQAANNGQMIEETNLKSKAAMQLRDIALTIAQRQEVRPEKKSSLAFLERLGFTR